jgi:hypothetical protein
VNIDFIKKMPNTNVLELEVVFRNDVPKSKNAGEYLATILMTREGQDFIKDSGYLPVSLPSD